MANKPTNEPQPPVVVAVFEDLIKRLEADSSIKEAAKQLAGSFSDVVDLRLGPCHDITLVRPDGYIAYSAHNHDGIAALESVRSLLERQTN